jgi:AcrR family transcriptional regulator
MPRASKGESTRASILSRAAALASQVGLGGLSIGTLASDLGLSKSGLFAHFRSKEALQLQVLEHSAARFVELVIDPALKAGRGEPRLRALFQLWRSWPRRAELPGGCPFIAMAVELDDQPGPARDLLVRQQHDWLEFLAGAARSGVAEGHLGAEVDAEQFAFELFGIMMSFHHHSRLLAEPRAERWAERAFEQLLDRSRP